jgi:hypothetical protein
VLRRAVPTLFIICLLVAPDAVTAEHSAKGVPPRDYSLAANSDDTNMRAFGGPPLVAPRATQRRAARRKGARRRASPPKSAPPGPAGGQAGGGGGQPPPAVLREDAGAGRQTARRPGMSEDEAVAEAFSAALNDALRKPLAGETRLLGVLTRVECNAEGLVFVVRAGERQLRLTSRDFEGVHITAYTPDAKGEMTCGPRKAGSRAVVTYRAAPDARAKTDGAITALEFVPANFQLRQ